MLTSRPKELETLKIPKQYGFYPVFTDSSVKSFFPCC